MSEFAKNLKDAMKSGARFLGKAANAAVHATRFKMNEMSALSKRRELISELGEKAFAMAIQGGTLPEELLGIVNQLTALEANISVLRADHEAQKAAAAEKAAAEKAERAAKKAAEKAAEAVAKGCEPIDLPAGVTISQDEQNAPEADCGCDAVTEDSAKESDVPTTNS